MTRTEIYQWLDEYGVDGVFYAPINFEDYEPTHYAELERPKP